MHCHSIITISTAILQGETDLARSFSVAWHHPPFRHHQTTDKSGHVP